MKKIIEKHENLVCYLLIVIYVVVNSYCMQNFGLTDYRSAIINTVFSIVLVVLIISSKRVSYYGLKYSLQGTTQGRYLTGGVPPVRFSM